MQKDSLFLVKIFVFVLLLTACRAKEFIAVFSTPGGPFEVSLELARTPEERRRGLMFRDRIGKREGMLFCFENDLKPMFWMKNTYVSLDILFLSRSGEVVDILERLPPCAMDPCPEYRSGADARYALEVHAGFADAHRVRRGDRVRLQLGPE